MREHRLASSFGDAAADGKLPEALHRQGRGLGADAAAQDRRVPRGRGADVFQELVVLRLIAMSGIDSKDINSAFYCRIKVTIFSKSGDKVNPQL